jgi:hypothetical protein
MRTCISPECRLDFVCFSNLHIHRFHVRCLEGVAAYKWSSMVLTNTSRCDSYCIDAERVSHAGTALRAGTVTQSSLFLKY